MPNDTPAAARLSPSYRTAKTRIGSSALSGHFPTEDATAFRALAASQGKDVQELLGEALNLIFTQYGLSNRINVTSGRRTRRAG
jgi:hypothetical protein